MQFKKETLQLLQQKGLVNHSGFINQRGKKQSRLANLSDNTYRKCIVHVQERMEVNFTSKQKGLRNEFLIVCHPHCVFW